MVVCDVPQQVPLLVKTVPLKQTLRVFGRYWPACSRKPATKTLRLVTVVFDVRLGSIFAVLKGVQMMPMR